jgi:hypothetical protein
MMNRLRLREGLDPSAMVEQLCPKLITLWWKTGLITVDPAQTASEVCFTTGNIVTDESSHRAIE